MIEDTFEKVLPYSRRLKNATSKVLVYHCYKNKWVSKYFFVMHFATILGEKNSNPFYKHSFMIVMCNDGCATAALNRKHKLL